MTEHIDGPDRTDGTDTNGAADHADRRWFRDVVAPVVDAEPVPDAWDDIRARATGEAPTAATAAGELGAKLVHLAPAPSADLPRRRRALLVAAAVLAVVGIVAGVVLTRDGDDERTVVAVPGPDDDATGWYVPEDLPDGWELESVDADWLDVKVPEKTACPCTTTAWASDDAELVLTSFLSTESPVEAPADPDDDRAQGLGSGVTGWVDEMERTIQVAWTDAGVTSQLWTLGLSREPSLDAARTLVAQGPATPPMPGLTERSSDTIPAGVRAYHSVLVTMVHQPSGRRATYGLIPEGFDPGTLFLLLPNAPTPEELPGQSLPVERVEVDANDGTGASEMLFHGRWPGSEVFVGRYVEPAPADPLNEDDLRLLAAALRPATGEQWRSFLDSASGPVADVARTDRLSDLIVHEGDPDDPDGSGDPGSDDGDVEPTISATSSDDRGEDQTDATARAAVDRERAQQLVELARRIDDGSGTLPPGLLAPTVDLALDFDWFVAEVDGPQLVSADAWSIDESDGVEAYAGYAAPFSAVELLARPANLEIESGGPVGCTGSKARPPELDHGWQLVTITPADGDSCLDWFAVTLVVDHPAGHVVAIHLYLWEP